MLKRTQTTRLSPGAYAGFRYFFANLFYPTLYREYLAVNNAHKVERGVRLQTALKANKVDIRTVLALPVTDSAHPYKQEFAWEKVYAAVDPKGATLYGAWYRQKVLSFYEGLQFHKWGLYVDDMIQCRGWWARSTRTRMPQTTLIHSDRRVFRGRQMKDKYLYEKKENWVRPTDNTAFMSPYVAMVSDEWEEKWGFFAGQDVEY